MEHKIFILLRLPGFLLKKHLIRKRCSLALFILFSSLTILSCNVVSISESDKEESTFLDLPRNHAVWSETEAVYASGVMDGCGPNSLRFCSGDSVTRGETTMILLRALLGDEYSPPPAIGMFKDVPVESPFAPWVELAVNRGITSGCSDSEFCPDTPVSRAQMPVFMLKTLEGREYSPPEATGSVFKDIPAEHTFSDWIEELFNRGRYAIGCSSTPLNFCPDDNITRSQMTVFVAEIFELQ